jgi:hypothetical protein
MKIFNCSNIRNIYREKPDKKDSNMAEHGERLVASKRCVRTYHAVPSHSLTLEFLFKLVSAAESTSRIFFQILLP